MNQRCCWGHGWVFNTISLHISKLKNAVEGAVETTLTDGSNPIIFSVLL
jgi:hypothetical protein